MANAEPALSSDLMILAALKDKQRYRSLRDSVPLDMLGPDARNLLGWFGAYFEAYPEHTELNPDALEAFMKVRLPNIEKDKWALIQHQIKRLKLKVPQDTINGVVGQLSDMDLSGKAAAMISRYNNGEELELVHELHALAEQARKAKAASTTTEWVREDVFDILEDEAQDVGLKFRQRGLQDHIKGLLGGVSIAIAARPDKGKTSFVSDTLTHFASQTQEFFGERPILWFNNEGKGRRIKPRLYQAALGVTLEELFAMGREEASRRYCEAIGHREDYIRIKDMHGASLAQAEAVIEEMKPCVVVWDMLANFRMAGQAGAKKFEAAEAMWQEVREMAVRHDFVSIATVQISADGDDQLYPSYSSLKDSKTGIQGATDVILMMGALNNPAMENRRGFSTAKNKFAVSGMPSNVQLETWFEPSTCRFEDGGDPL